jgi:putative transcriptional regulator
MSDSGDAEWSSGVLDSKRDATQYRILVQIAERQPAVSQQEIAEAIGVTSQAVSNYLRELIEQGRVDKLGRGRYEVTKEGVDWLISRTDDLRTLVDHVTEEVVDEVGVESALATGSITEGDRVSLSMRDGVLRATPGDDGSATAVAVTDAAAGQEVGVTDFEGVVDYDLGTVTVMSVPTVQQGGSQAADAGQVADLAAQSEVLAVSSPEALALARAADLDPDIRFGTPEAVRGAATKGLDVLLLAASDDLSAHTETLRDSNVSYQVIDVPAE